MNIKPARHLPAFLTLLVATGLAQAAEPLLYYVLDGSGSMWGRVEGTPKITVAKDTLADLIARMPDNVQTGLTVYGHRRKGDCNDIQELVPPGPADKARITEVMRAITPKGKTPIAAALRQVAERVKTREGETTVVLVSDGIETCGADPCQATRALKESGAGFIVHVVGFDVGRKATEQLQCIAAAGGGHYFPAANAGELARALQTVKAAVVEKKPLPAPEPEAITQEVQSSTTSKRIKIKGPGRVTIKTPSWVKKPYYWKLVDAESGGEKARFHNLDTQLVPAGEYQLVWRQGEHSATEVMLSEVVRVESGKTAEVQLLTAVNPVAADWVPKEAYYWGLREPASKKWVARFAGRLGPQLVPAGTYDFIYRMVEHGTSEVNLGRVEIKADKMNELTMNSGIRFIPPAGLEPPYRIFFKQLDADGKTVQRVDTGGGFGPFVLPPGKWRVDYWQKEHGSRPVTLVDSLALPAGTLLEIEL